MVMVLDIMVLLLKLLILYLVGVYLKDLEKLQLMELLNQ